MSQPMRSSGGNPLTILTVFVLVLIAGFGVFSFLGGRGPFAANPPVTTKPRGNGSAGWADKEIASRFTADENAKLAEFSSGATARDPRVREATLRNEPLVRVMRELVMRADPPVDVAAVRRDVVTVLKERLKDESPAVRLAAVEAVAMNILDRWAAFPPDGLKPEDALPVAEALLTDADAAVRLRAALFLWRERQTVAGGQVLVAVLKDANAPLADRLLATDLKSPRWLAPRLPAGMMTVLVGVIAEPTAPAELRTKAVKVIEAAGAEATPALTADLRQKLQSALTDGTLSGELRADVLHVLAPESGKPLPDDLRKMAAKLAETADTPVPLRVRAFGVLEPWSVGFVKAYPELVERLRSAVTDPKQDPAFRAYAARFYTPDTAEEFAELVRLLAETDANTAPLRWVLAERMSERLYPDTKTPPREWLTTTVLKRLAAAPSSYSVNQDDMGYAANGRRWQTAAWSTDITALSARLLASRWEELLPELLASRPNFSAFTRNEQAIRAVMKDHPTELWKALEKVVTEADDHAKRVRAVGWLYSQEEGKWPKAVFVPWSDRLVAKGITPDEQRFLLKWQLGSSDSPLDGYRALLRSQRGAARAAVAEEGWKLIAPELVKRELSAKAAVPDLIAALRDEYPNGTAPYLLPLAEIGKDSVPALGELLEDSEPKLRAAAADALGQIGPPEKAKSTPLLRAAVEREKDVAVKKALLDALGKVNPTEAAKLGGTAK